MSFTATMRKSVDNQSSDKSKRAWYRRASFPRDNSSNFHYPYLCSKCQNTLTFGTAGAILTPVHGHENGSTPGMVKSTSFRRFSECIAKAELIRACLAAQATGNSLKRTTNVCLTSSRMGQESFAVPEKMSGDEQKKHETSNDTLVEDTTTCSSVDSTHPTSPEPATDLLIDTSPSPQTPLLKNPQYSTSSKSSLSNALSENPSPEPIKHSTGDDGSDVLCVANPLSGSPTVKLEFPESALTYSSRTQVTVNAKIRRASSGKRKGREEDDLSEVDASAVPEEVRDWLASTFTRKMGSGRRDGEKPKFKSIVNALRAGMFVERMFRRMSGLQGLQYPAALVPHLKAIDEWNVDMFALNEAANGSALKYVTYELLNRYDLVSKFKVPVSNLINFLDKIESGYSVHDNPYHNLIHGADVTQTCHYFMLQTGLMNWLTDLEIFAVLIAACCHDVEHTGTTNNFHINTQSPLALLYNDKSVLESHHVSHTFRVMRDHPECNILGNLSRDDFMEFRQLVVDMILATDMSFHFSQLKAMKTSIGLPDPVEKTKALSLVLHTADISHPAKEWDVHYKWTMLVIEEFFQQGDREAELGLPYSPLCDRHTLVIPDSQIGFINFIVAPSMEVCGDMMDKIVAPIDREINNSSRKSSSHNSHSSLASDQRNHAPQSRTTPSGELGAAGSGDTNNNCDTESCSPSFAINRPWDPLIANNRNTWKQKSVEEETIKKEEESKKQKETEASMNGPVSEEKNQTAAAKTEASKKGSTVSQS